MCTVAPILLPGLAGAAATVPSGVRATIAATLERALATPCADVAPLLRGLDAATPLPVAAPAPSRQDEGADMEDALRGIRSLTLPAASLAAAHGDDDANPTTPVAQLDAPHSYGGADEGGEPVTVETTKLPPETKRRPPEWHYDADIDATLRAMERDPRERPSAEYLRERQAGEMTTADRAELIDSMYDFSRGHDLARGTLHRAVSFVDRFLSARKVGGGGSQLQTLGAAAVFAAAKYEEQSTLDEIGADAAAEAGGCSRRELLDAELELVAALGYRLSGPTAHTFVDHFTRHEEEEEAAVGVRSLAHHLADMALLDYRCVASLPSAVAASAIVLARLVMECPTTAPAPVAGYTAEDLSECVDAIYDMHVLVWPGCGRMMKGWEEATRNSYTLPPRSKLHELELARAEAGTRAAPEGFEGFRQSLARCGTVVVACQQCSDM